MNVTAFQERQLNGHVQLNVATTSLNSETLIFLHGVTRRWQDFHLLYSSLMPRWRIVALDFRGHGSSARSKNYHVVDYLQDALQLIDSLPDNRIVVYGHSLGAMVAAAAGAARPGKVRAVILEDPPFHTLGKNIESTPFWSQFSGTKEALVKGASDLEKLTENLAAIPISVGEGIVKPLGELRDKVSLRFGARCLQEMDPAVLDPLIEGHWLNGYEFERIAQSLTCPALLLQANPSIGGMLTSTDAELFVSHAPCCYLIPFPQTGHLIHWMEPMLLLRHVTGFLESLE